MESVLISACLLGRNTKYNGGNNYKEEVNQLNSICKLIPICPEVDGGLSIPRIPAEIQKDKVINKNGVDVTREYINGARNALDLAKSHNVKYAILKEKSPSCGVHEIYDGTFSGIKISGQGITTKMLDELGILVFNENEIDKLVSLLKF